MGKPGARAVDKRMRFVTGVEVSEERVTALCRRFGFSRKTGYKWLERYRSEGIEGLSDRSRAPREHRHAVTAALAERCLAVRRTHPTWGPVKVRAWLDRHDGEAVGRAAGADGAGQAAAERRARAPASDAAARCRHAAGAQPARAAQPALTSNASITRSARMPRSATTRRPSITRSRRGAGMACCA